MPLFRRTQAYNSFKTAYFEEEKINSQRRLKPDCICLGRLCAYL